MPTSIHFFIFSVGILAQNHNNSSDLIRQNSEAPEGQKAYFQNSVELLVFAGVSITSGEELAWFGMAFANPQTTAWVVVHNQRGDTSSSGDWRG